MKAIPSSGSDAVTLSLPYPPSVNHYYGRTPHGSVYIKEMGRAYRIDVGAHIMAAKIKGFGTDPVSVSIAVYPPTRRRYDLDNICKCLLDSLTHAGIWEDDSQIQHLELRKMDVVKGGKVEVTIRSCNGGMSEQIA